jgi:hypothetical protein
LAFAQAARSDRLGLCGVLLSELLPKLVVELDEGVTGDAGRDAIETVGEELAAVLTPELREGFFAVAPRDHVEEARAVDIAKLPVRPAHRIVAQLCEGRNPAFERVHAQVHVEDRAAQAAAARAGGFLVRRKALDQPAGCDGVGGDRLAEDRVDQRRDAANLIEVQDVCVLVCDERTDPVVVVADGGEVAGGRREQLDLVSGYDTGAAVGLVGLVGQ